MEKILENDQDILLIMIYIALLILLIFSQSLSQEKY